MSINFCHIAPTRYLQEYTETNGAHLILAHLVEQDPAYRDFYANIENDGRVKIMDNSAFEMYKQGRAMYPSDKLMDMARACKASTVVLSDYPGEPASKTIKAAEESLDAFHNAGFYTFFVPQSTVGHLGEYLECIEWAIESDADLIGLSILGAPNAFGVERGNKLQRFMSRWQILNLLEERGSLDYRAVKRFHCLGMVDGPNEIRLLEPFHDFIYSWDSSAAVWAGLNGISFDHSPTGMVNGKYETEVDFSYVAPDMERVDAIVRANIAYIDHLAGNHA